MNQDNSIEGDAQSTNRSGPTSVVDRTAYAPVQMQEIETPGAATSVETPTPIGRHRVGNDDLDNLEDHRVVIPHQSCEHILVAGLPRVGKDSVVASIGKNLKDEHGYSYVSVHDDGRMETPMLSIPNDENRMQNVLEKFDQTPEGVDSEVFVPATGDLPEYLPANFRPFTLSRDALPPSLFTQGDLERQDALDLLSDHGVLAPDEAETALDMQEVIANNERAAVLCCSFIDIDYRKPEDLEQFGKLKYTLMDLWLRLVYHVRDENPRLPRVCLEARDLDTMAPSRLQDSSAPETIKGLRRSATRIATEGGSRGILMVSSTSEYTGVYGPVRENIPTKVLMRCSEDTVEPLDNIYNFSDGQKRALSSFNRGEGTLITDGKTHRPPVIEFRPSPTGLGIGDLQWRDRYGRAWGARVRMGGYESVDANWWTPVRNPSGHSAGVPEVGDWYLVSEDFPENTDPEDVDEDLVAEVLEDRRAEGVYSNLSLVPTNDLL